MRPRHRPIVLLALSALMTAACGDLDRPTVSADPVARDPASTDVPSTAAPETVAPTTTTTLAAAPNGVTLPRAALDPAGLAAQIVEAERGIRDPAATPARRTELARLQQVAYRKLSYEPAWDAEVLAAVPDELDSVVERNVFARRQFLAMHSVWPTEVPDWRIIEPVAPDQLLAWYREAEADTGIPWTYLAAINLVETGMGRIHGLSSAGAQGPMQFLPSTWEEVSDGDINDPHEAIGAAARYLVRRGGPADMDRALFGYNNHDNYVRAVTTYAELMAENELAFFGYHGWEIFFLSERGDLWLPVGYEVVDRVPVSEYLVGHPWSAPPPETFVPLTDPLPVPPAS